jgi:hypothetical protein
VLTSAHQMVPNDVAVKTTYAQRKRYTQYHKRPQKEAGRAGKKDRPCTGQRLRQEVGNQTRWASLMSKNQNMERRPAMAVTMGRRRQIGTGPNLRSRHENKRTTTASEKRLNIGTESRNKAGLPSTREADPKERANAE